MHVPTHQDVHGNCQQIEDGTHAGNLCQQVACRRIQACPCTKLLFQEGVGADTTAMAVEGYEVFGSKITCDGYAEREYEGVPVGSKSLAWIADVAYTADVCGKY